MSPLLLCAILSLLSITSAQDRSPHGLAYASPMALSPSAFTFFHPDNHQQSKENPCVTLGCSPLPTAAIVQSSLAYESRSPPEKGGGRRLKAGGILGLVFGFTFVVVLAVGVFYVVTKRHNNMTKNSSAEAEA